ncbi:hypothetical protein M2459_003100 [Parabacteroides sp. PF5-5]|uniref:hypothetical protein n=1 Tax=unclassified Parabacteroides TaxID=2649774 RepID=UPI002473A2B0|nr:MULTISPECIES: hypothetical protein [unclassified Parabacteroides]MDH6305890.1 hypothetical protein [Parabacteroides sp. PH5-39]MDH6317297.1 hypothetical protein [Parabacteroides sp. PF5-13]MDH6320505.1 hypothetical protein [Parabacteroides sp. PH5-13]MDH6324333.1 hypothetical protein [Parabacteroides sp. PH5-8]MDH6328529.1 hypothetical protein [Parabacteroides sp. PH5-41]
MEIIISIIVGLVILFVVYAICSALFKSFPMLMYILAGIVAIGIGVTSTWWIGIIVGLIALGLFARMQENGGHRCIHCNSYDTVEQEIDEDLIDSLNWKQKKPEIWEIKDFVKCNKCGQYSAIYKN